MATAIARNVLARAARRPSQLCSRSSRYNIPSSSYTPISNNNNNLRWLSSYPPHEVVGMPSLSPTMESGTISAWNVDEGSAYAAGDSICSIETDKATIDFEAQDDGIVAKIIAQAGSDDIPCGTPIMVTVEEEGDVAAFKDFVVESSSAASPEPAVVEEPTPTQIEVPVADTITTTSPPPPTPLASSGERVFASPRAHTLAKEKGYGEISALRIVGTGPGGRIIAEDVLNYDPSSAPITTESTTAATTTTQASAATPAAAAPLPEPVVGAGFTDYALPASALELASRLHTSKQNVPHYYLTIDLTLDSLMDLRTNLNSTMKLDEDDNSGGITVNDLLMKAAAAAMKTVPAANASWMDSFVRVYDSVDINVVVGNGSSLYAPVIRDVGRKGLKAVADDVATATSVVEGEGSDPTTVPGFGDVGTFTMVNLGMFGVKSCAPIIREPQACALALGVIENRIVPNDNAESEEIYKESVMMTATLSCDHRVVDGAVGAQWLSAFKNHVENPVTLLL